ncbi:MIR motif-containing protein [Suillus ampliporus]|nr:MIR motif-containing protein [Suillus ampliporus]
MTDKALHSHDVSQPVSDVDFQNEVSGYGMAGFIRNINNNSSDKESSTRLRMLRMHFKLRHLNTGYYLFSHKVKLPEWGFNQQEVTYNKNTVKANLLYKRVFIIAFSWLTYFTPGAPSNITSLPPYLTTSTTLPVQRSFLIHSDLVDSVVQFSLISSSLTSLPYLPSTSATSLPSPFSTSPLSCAASLVPI